MKECNQQDDGVMFGVMFTLLFFKSVIMTIGLRLFGVEVYAWQVAIIVCFYEIGEYLVTRVLEWVAAQKRNDDSDDSDDEDK